MIIVTGGAGFIGSNILAGLEQLGEKNLVAVDHADAALQNLSKRNLTDFIAPDALSEFCSKNQPNIRAIIHMGATSSTMITDASLFVRNNYLYSLMLWRWCAKYRVPFIYASSAATYGSGSMGFDDNASTIKELAQFQPLNFYGRSKNLFDRMVAHEIARKHQLPPQWVGLKFFNVYAPNEYHKGNQKSVIATIFPDALAGRPVKLFKSHDPAYKDGGQLRDFVWVGDCVQVILWLLENTRVNGIFNVGSGKSRSFSALAKSVFTALGGQLSIEYIDMPIQLRAKYQYFTQANMSRLRDQGYNSLSTSLEDGVKTYVQNFLMKKDPYL